MSIVILAVVLLLLGIVIGEQPAKALPSVAPAAPILPPVQPPTQAGGIPGIGPELPTSRAIPPGSPGHGMLGVLGGSSMPVLGAAKGNMGTSSQGFGGLEAVLGKLGAMGGELGSPVPMPPMPPMPCPSLIASLLRMGNGTDKAQLQAICEKELGSMCTTVFKELGPHPWTVDAVNKTCDKFGYNITRAWQEEMQDEQQETMKKLQTIIQAAVNDHDNSQIRSQRLFDVKPSIPGGSRGLGNSAWAAFGAGCIVTAVSTVLFVRGRRLIGTRPIGMAPVEGRDLEEQMHASEEQSLHE